MAEPRRRVLLMCSSVSRMRLRDAVAVAQHSQYGIFVRDEPRSAVRIGSDVFRRVQSQDKQRDGLVLLADQCDDLATWQGPRNPLNIEARQ